MLGTPKDGISKVGRFRSEISIAGRVKSKFIGLAIGLLQASFENEVSYQFVYE